MKRKITFSYILASLFSRNAKNLKFIPDELYLKILFRGYTGRKLNLANPRSFNEKLQWLKINDRNDEYTTLVDKYEVKEVVSKIIGKEYIIPTLGIWESFDEIDFDKLPQKFVLKCTHDSGGIVICRDKNTFDLKKAKKVINKSLKKNFFYLGREYPYKKVKPRIICEAYMEDINQKSLIDYKFYCFEGEPQFLYVSQGLENHATARLSFINLDWTFAPYYRHDYFQFEKLPKKPKNFDRMVDFAKKLSKGKKFIRVDLYEINDKIYFSELTFTPGSGWMAFKNESEDIAMGKFLNLNEVK